jgi:hypothetical protein
VCIGEGSPFDLPLILEPNGDASETSAVNGPVSESK